MPHLLAHMTNSNPPSLHTDDSNVVFLKQKLVLSISGSGQSNLFESQAETRKKMTKHTTVATTRAANYTS
jgi:hypothetical protein